MDFKNEITSTSTQINGTTTQSRDTLDRVLQISFKWAKNTVSITEPGHDTPIYLGKLNPWTLKTVYRQVDKNNPISNVKSDSSVSDDASSVIGEGNIGWFNIDCQTQIRGRAVRLSADSRLYTRYTYPSLAYASSPSKPEMMTWKSNSTFKVFDFDLLDSDHKVVARFSPRYLGIRKIATIELFGAKAWTTEALEEVLITGLTMYICMIYRSSSIVSLAGALTGRKGKDYKVTGKEMEKAEERQWAEEEDTFNAMNKEERERYGDEVWKKVERQSTMDEEGIEMEVRKRR